MNKRYNEYALIQKESAEYLYNIIKHTGYNNALDVGAGTGFLSTYLKNYTAIDIDISLRDYHKNFVVGDIESLPFKDKSFDLVVSNFSIHLCNINLAIRELMRVSSKYLACSFPIEGSLEGWIYPFVKKDQVLELLKGRIVFLEEKRYSINLKGLQLLKFINITGKPKVKKSHENISPSLVKQSLAKLENSSFNVLSFLLEV